MTDVPELKRHEVEDELKRLHRYPHRVLSAAFLARGEKGEVAIDLDGKSVAFSVVPVHCELELRRALSHREPHENLALLLDWFPEPRLAADLHARLAGGRVYKIERGRQIVRLFQTTAVSGEVLACKPLAEELLRPGRPPMPIATSGSTLDLGGAWRGLLAREAGWDPGTGLGEDTLLAHAAQREPPATLAAALAPGTPAGNELLTYLERREVAGPLAPWMWRAWLTGRAKDFAALAFLFHPAAARWTEEAGLRALVLAQVQGVSPPLRDLVLKDPSLASRWGDLAEPLNRRLDETTRRDVLAKANAWLTPHEADAVVESPYLPHAFAARSRRLASILTSAVASEPSRPGVISLLEQARGELERLEKHVLAESGSGRERVGRAHMAVRLVGYIASRFAGGDRLTDEIASYGTMGPLFALAQHQVVEGAWVDHARERARGAGTEELDHAIDAVVARADAARDVDDERFAGAHAAYLTAGSPRSTHVLPIAKAVDHFAVGFLEEKSHRRLAIVLLDGMAWANAVELLQSMEEERYAPLRWAGGKVMPMLAALPTLTEISRSAFFAGKPIKAGDAADTSKDPERFAAHAGLRKIGIEDAPLLLKADVAAPEGGLGKKARDLLASDARVVALVVNAIDDQLKGAKQLHVKADLETIKPMRALLETATEAGRAVLLVADHGHVRAERMKAIGYGTGAGKRYRYLSADEEPRAEEVALGRDAAWVAPGKAKVAMLRRERDSYGTPSATGEHGGASIAEVVAPAILVGSDVLRAQVRNQGGEDDAELDVAPFARPDWWDLQLPKKAAARPAPMTAAPPQKRRKSDAQVQQVKLPGFEPAAAAAATSPAPVAEVESPSLAVLRASRLFTGRAAAEVKKFRDSVAPRIALLLDAGGPMPSDVFARKAGVMTTSVGGVIAEMQEWLDFESMVIEYDPVAKRVAINVELLREYLPEIPGR